MSLSAWMEGPKVYGVPIGTMGLTVSVLVAGMIMFEAVAGMLNDDKKSK